MLVPLVADPSQHSDAKLALASDSTLPALLAASHSGLRAPAAPRALLDALRAEIASRTKRVQKYSQAMHAPLAAKTAA